MISERLSDYLPADVELISQSSHTVYRSVAADAIYRVDHMDLIAGTLRIDDSIRAHRVSWCLGHNNKYAVVAPTTAEPIIVDGCLISTYPLLSPIRSLSDLTADHATELGTLLAQWSFACRDCEHGIDTLCVDEYVHERLGYASLHESNALRVINTDVSRAVSLLEEHYPFSLLNHSMLGYVHGDLHHGNFVLDGSGRLNVIDFDSFKFGSPAYDVGVLRYFEKEVLTDTKMTELVTTALLDEYKRHDAWKVRSLDEGIFVAGEAWKRVSSLSRMLATSDGSDESIWEIDMRMHGLLPLVKELSN